MRHSLFRYFDERRWVDDFLIGQLYFRPLSYFRFLEDGLIRGDHFEGVSVYAPKGGLVVTNQSRGTTFTLHEHRLESTVRQDDIWVYCLSRVRSEDLAAEFRAVACVEILDIPEFCRRVRAALPRGAHFIGRRVAYYRATEAGNPRWALPDQIATSKLDLYARQAEFRLVFSSTDALGFENVTLRLIEGPGEMPPPPKKVGQVLPVGSLADICHVHEVCPKGWRFAR
jgi:hypothetical protein